MTIQKGIINFDQIDQLEKEKQRPIEWSELDSECKSVKDYFLRFLPAGLYTTLSKSASGHFFQLDMHLDRLKLADPRHREILKSFLQSDPQLIKESKDLRISLYRNDDDERRVVVLYEEMPSFKHLRGVQVEIRTTQPRSNANEKNSQWIK
jgi:hypothetical protein